MRQVRSLLRESVGEDTAERREGSEALENGGPLDIDEEPLPPLPAARDTGSFFKRNVPGRELRRQHNDRGVSEYVEPGDWLPGCSPVWVHVVQRRPHREGA